MSNTSNNGSIRSNINAHEIVSRAASPNITFNEKKHGKSVNEFIKAQKTLNDAKKHNSTYAEHMHKTTGGIRKLRKSKTYRKRKSKTYRKRKSKTYRKRK